MRLLRSLLPLVVLAALLVLVPAASATLVYVMQPSRGPSVLWSAANDGTGAVRLGTNYYGPQVSPDGTMVAASKQTRSGANLLYVLPTAGGPAQRLLAKVGFATVAWSPNSQLIAAISGRRLMTISVPDGTVTTLATGVFNGAALSFSPSGDAIVYSSATSSTLNASSDIYTVPVAGGAPTQLTFDGLSSNPVWGPTQIAYSKGPKRRNDYPKLNIWLMNLDGSDQHQLTFVRVRSLVTGLNPVEWSASGAQLLANFGGQDTSQAFAVDPLTGSARDLGAKPFDGTSPGAISRDGTTVLAQTGGQEGPSPGQGVVTIPFDGGPPTTLVPRGLNPDWNA
jgi:Tol biopolymer transport system component